MNECLRIPDFDWEDREILPGLWYLACPASAIRPGQILPVDMLDRPVLLGRLNSGELFAYRDACPGCGVPLRYGAFENDRLSCCLQGWRFDALDGACMHGPSGADELSTSAAYFRLDAVPVVERYGQVWILSRTARQATFTAPFFPGLPISATEHPQISAVLRLPHDFGPASHAVDAVHPTFARASRWWTQERTGLFAPKRKEFEATALGFRVRCHGLKPHRLPYRLFGPEISIDIEFRLPGIRIEHISGSRGSACILMAATPAAGGVTDLHCSLYWTVPWLAPAKPILRHMLRTFLEREHDLLARPKPGKRPTVPTRVPDRAFRERNRETEWFHRIRQEFIDSSRHGRPFLNPVAAQAPRA